MRREARLIAIVGGGITGLALAHHLAARAVPHLVLEASENAGGVIRSERVGEHLLERGPQRTRLVGPVRELVDALGVGGEVITAPPGLPLFVYRRGKLRRVPFSAVDFLRGDIVSAPAKARALLEPLTAGARPGERVSGFLTRKVGRELYENLLGPLYGGLYASDPADMEMELSLSLVLRELGIGRSLLLACLRRGGRISPPPAASFARGMQTLPQALLEANRENVRLGAPVRRITRSRDGYRLELDGEEVRAERVVMTAPAASASRLLREVDGDVARRIGFLRYNPLAVVYLRAEDGPRGMGFQLSLAEGLATRGVTFNHSLFGRDGVYTAYLGGSSAPALVKETDNALAALAAREFALVTGCRAETIAVRRVAVPAWDRSWRALRGMLPPRGLHLAAGWESRPGIPGRLVQAKRLAAELAGEE